MLTDVPNTLPAPEEDLRVEIAARLTRARQRTALLTDAVDDGDLVRQHSRLMSPLVWDLAHIGNQEELWLLRDVGGREPMLPETVDRLYDAFQHPRANRPTLPLLDPGESRRYVAQVRERVLDLVATAPLAGPDVRSASSRAARRLTEHGFIFGMIAQHEQQHDETMLATHQLRQGAPVLTGTAPLSTEDALAAVRRLAPMEREVLVPAGEFTMGTSAEPWALDNERPAHTVHIGAFWIDRVPVTNGEYRAFVEDGGYDDPRWWIPAGWAHRVEADLVAPAYWRQDGGVWVRDVFGRVEPVEEHEPVVHVCWYEADAYARWAGRRLPTEAEWEKAARWDPATGRSRRYPWGDEDPTPERANLGQRHLRPTPVGAYPLGASPLGVEQLIGDVWEWTSSRFSGYPGFAAWPYREYSEVFFGTEYRVLRGGSFGADEVACRGTFRNWDYPIRRQIFSGFRCARDAAVGAA